MALTEQRHTVRFPLPHLVEATRATLIQAPVYLDGALVAPTGAGSSTLTIRKADGTDLVTGATVVVTASVGEYTVLGSATALTDLGEGWSATWTLLVGSTTIVARNDMAVVRRQLRPVISDVDLIRRVRALDTSLAAVITTQSNYQDQIDDSWLDIQLRLYERGNRANLVMTPSAFVRSHRALALAYIFEDLVARGNASYSDTAKRYRDEFESAWADLSFTYSSSDALAADSNTRRRAADPTMWLAGAPAQRSRWGER